MSKKTYMAPALESIVLHAPVVLFDGSTPQGNLGDFVEGTQAAPDLDLSDNVMNDIMNGMPLP